MGETGGITDRGSVMRPMAAEADPVCAMEQQVRGSDRSLLAPETRHLEWVTPWCNAWLMGELTGALQKCSPGPD